MSKRVLQLPFKNKFAIQGFRLNCIIKIILMFMVEIVVSLTIVVHVMQLS